MPLPATAQELYDLLVADEAITDGLGTYTFADGTQLPAIAVLATNEQLPPGTMVDGVEVTITLLPMYGPQSLYSGVLLNPTFRVYIAGWQSAATLQAMAERVMALLPGASSRTIDGRVIDGSAAGEDIGLIDQVVVAWTNVTAVVSA